MLLPFIDFFSITAASGEMEAIFDIEKPLDAALDLLDKGVQYAVVRNGGESVAYAFNDEINGKTKFGEIPVEKLDNGYFSYSGAIFNGAFISAILNEETTINAIKYAAAFATEKCRLGSTLNKKFPTSNK
jgi:sugar/nucleoside kinase (ribokinase family)